MLKSFVLIIVISLAILAGYFYYTWHNGVELMGTTIKSSNMMTSHASEFSGWIADWDQASGSASLKDVGRNFKTVLPIGFKLTEDGELIKIDNTVSSEIISTANESKIKIMPTLANDFDGKRTSLFLNNQENIKTGVELLLSEAVKYGYAGYDLDWEEIKEADKVKFVEFCEYFKKELTSKTLRLSITVHAQLGKDDWEGTKGQDLKKLGEIADEVRVMAYDFHNTGSEPGAVTPLAKLEEVLKYNSKVVPVDKLVIGLPTYGYDWGEPKNEGVQYNEVQNRLVKYSGEAKRDPKEQSMIAKYSLNESEHVIYYDDAESLKVKIALAKKYGVYKFCFWRVGGEDKEIWGIN